MATYYWTGATSADITVASNWHGGQVPVGGSDTIVKIGSSFLSDANEPTIRVWPDGGHLDMEIAELHVKNTAASNIAAGSIGSSSDYLKASNVRSCYLGGGSDPAGSCDMGWPWGTIDLDPAPVSPMERDSHTYLHLESPANGPDTVLYIKSCIDYGHIPRYYFHLRGNPVISFHSTSEAEIHINDAPSAIDGGTPVKAEQGPVSMHSVTTTYMGLPIGDLQGTSIRNSVIYMDWQSGDMGGNPVYGYSLDVSSSTIYLNAQQITKFSLHAQTAFGDGKWTGGNAIWDGLPVLIQVQSADPISEETEAVACTEFFINGFHPSIDPLMYTPPKVTFLSGINIGTFKTQVADIIFSPKAAFKTMIIDGSIGAGTRLDASAISAGNWILGYQLTGKGVQITGGTHTKIKPPMNSNIRIA